MKANEFIKKFGWGTSKFCLDNCLSPNDKWFMHEGESIYDEDFDELKRLVESHEIIQKDFESVEMADYEHMISGCYSDPYWIRVKQAIADVESCQ